MKNQNNGVWGSDAELTNDPRFAKAAAKEEFISLPIVDQLSSEEITEKAQTNRRDFLKYVGFGLGAATVAASCDIPVKRAIPYVVKPDSIVPGVASYYASSFFDGSDYCPVLVKTREGRPIKIEGNSMSSITKGGTSARAQASVLSLYDTSRIQGPSAVTDGDVDRSRRNGSMTWAELDAAVGGQLTGRSRIRIVTNTIISPSTKRAIADFSRKYPNTQVVTYDPVSASAMLEANQADFGQEALPSYHFDKADVIVSFGADFLGTWISPIEFAADYSTNRVIKDVKDAKMSRHVQVEANMSLTGSNADNRIIIKPSENGAAIAALAKELGIGGSGPALNERAAAGIKRVAAELKAARGKALVVSGSNNVGEQMLVNAINNSLGSYGNTITWDRPSYQRQGLDRNIQGLIREMNGGGVDAVFVTDGANPAFDIPNADQFAAGMAKVKTKVYFGGVMNETGALCGYAAPTHHYLESWGDAEPKAGVYSLIQPTIRPLFNTRQAEETLLRWAGIITEAAEDNKSAAPQMTQQTPEPDTSGLGDNTSFTTVPAADTTQNGGEAVPVPVEYESTIPQMIAANADAQPYMEYVQQTWRRLFAAQSKFAIFNMFWDSALHDGVFEGPASGNSAGSYGGSASAGASKISKPSAGELEIVFYETVNVGAGRHLDNPWLTEMPDPVTRTVWGNYLGIPVSWDGSNEMQALKGLNPDEVYGYADKVNLTAKGVEADGVTCVRQFGLAQNTVAMALGYGRTVIGQAGKEVGTNVYPMLRLDANGNTQYYATEVAVSEKIETDKRFPAVQYHHTMGVKAADESGEVINVDEKTVMTVGEGYQGGLVNRSVIFQANLSEVSDLAHRVEEFRKEANHLNDQTLYPFEEYSEEFYSQGHHWGMHVDLNACTGCAACQVACIAENNVPVVGRAEVARHHEMTWLRIDRYYYGDFENPNVVYQPMMCQHCDNAPCENVCPVAATNHSSEGLNQMTYNRCIGTRYCANNCPYKVRRFNWLDYTTADLFPANSIALNGEEYGVNDNDGTPWGADNLTRMVLNPDVTVRSRGVIEKCSFCVQRIQEGKLTAKKEGRTLRDGEVKTACQTACPTGAITFGDMNNKKSALMQNVDNELNYRVLEEINTQSSVYYSAKVVNRDTEIS